MFNLSDFSEVKRYKLSLRCLKNIYIMFHYIKTSKGCYYGLQFKKSYQFLEKMCVSKAITMATVLP